MGFASTKNFRHALQDRTSLLALATALGVVAVVVLSGGAVPALPTVSATGTSNNLLAAGTSIPSAKLTVGAFSTATSIPAGFWGVNVAALQAFGSTDAAAVAKTPVTYVRFPGGILGEEYNYTSGVITSQSGTHSHAATTLSTFVSSCNAFHCKAILQLPAEIDDPGTAAYYAHYVVHSLGFQPAYWEIGNAPSGWKHMGVPWGQWSTKTGTTPTPQNFATLVKAYIQAVDRVDAGAKFLALGAGMGDKNYAQKWVTALVQADGKNLSGISVHSYIMGGGPSHPTDQQFLANLQGQYSLPDQIHAVEGFIHTACSSCKGLQVFVSEINGAEVSTYDQLLPGFAGSLYLAAETTQGLSLGVPNMDWFCYDCSYGGAWSQHPSRWQMQYYLFSDLLSQLQNQYLPLTVSGPSTFYAAATYGTGGLALLLVNVNTTTAVNVAVAHVGITLHSSVGMYTWNGSAKQPHQSTLSLRWNLKLGPESIVLLVANPLSLV